MADTTFVNATSAVPGTPIVAPWLNDVNSNTYTVLAGIAGTNTITGTGATTVTGSYPRGVAFRFLPVNNNTGATTININGIGVRNLTKFGTDALVANDLRTGMWAYVAYDGAQFQLINPRTTDFLFPSGILPVANGGTGVDGTAGVGRLIGTQVFTVNGTYTPTAGTKSIVVEVQGGGGAGGGSLASVAGQVSIGSGGGGGGYGKSRLTSGFSGTVVTVATASAGVVGGVGTTGGTSSFGAFIVANGGLGGVASPVAAGTLATQRAGGTCTGGNIVNLSGGVSDSVIASFSAAAYAAGAGGNSILGFGAAASGAGVAGNITALAGTNYGGGGGGGGSSNGGGATAGGSGAPGIVIVYEYA